MVVVLVLLVVLLVVLLLVEVLLLVLVVLPLLVLTLSLSLSCSGNATSGNSSAYCGGGAVSTTHPEGATLGKSTYGGGGVHLNWYSYSRPTEMCVNTSRIVTNNVSSIKTTVTNTSLVNETQTVSTTASSGDTSGVFKVRNAHLLRSSVDRTLPSPQPCFGPLTPAAAARFQLMFGGQTSASIAFDASHTDVQTALNDLSSVSGVTVSRGAKVAGGYAWNVTFDGRINAHMGNLSALSCVKTGVGSTLGGADAACAVVEVIGGRMSSVTAQVTIYTLVNSTVWVDVCHDEYDGDGDGKLDGVLVNQVRSSSLVTSSARD